MKTDGFGKGQVAILKLMMANQGMWPRQRIVGWAEQQSMNRLVARSIVTDLRQIGYQHGHERHLCDDAKAEVCPHNNERSNHFWGYSKKKWGPYYLSWWITDELRNLHGMEFKHLTDKQLFDED